MVPADFKLPFFDSPLGFIVVLLAIIAGFYLFVGNKTPVDYHRQGKELEKKTMQQGNNSKEAERNGERGEKIEQVSVAGGRSEREGRWSAERDREDGERRRAKRRDDENEGISRILEKLSTPEARRR